MKSAWKNSPRLHDLLLNPDEVARRRIPLAQADLNLSKTANWACHHCGKKFISEVLYMKHFCEPRRRHDEMRTVAGQSAFGFYKEWMRQKRFAEPSIDAFKQSKYYRSFINFANLVVAANIAKPEKYIQLMVDENLLPILWCRDAAYSRYIDWVDRIESPAAQIVSSVDTLTKISSDESVQMEKIFKHLGAQRIINMVRNRTLSPWLIFCCKTFGAVLSSFDASEKRAFNTVVNPTHWAEKFKANPSLVADAKNVAAEVGL